MFILVHLFLYIANGLISSNEAGKILAVFPTPSISHQVVFRPLTQELAKRGHEVVVITTDPAFPKGKAPANLTEIDVHNVSYSIWQQFVKKAPESNLREQMKLIYKVFTKVFENQMNTDEVQMIIHNKSIHFDLLLLEACVKPALSFSHIYKVSVIQVSSFGAVYGNYETIGAPTHPFLYPSNIRQRLYNLSLWEKITEMYNEISIKILWNSLEGTENEMVRRIFGPDTPTLSELSNNVDMLFLNVHPIWEGNRPVPPGVIYIAGIHEIPEEDLPKDLQSILDSSVNGVIYISFGSNICPSLLSPEKIQLIVKVFSQLPYTVLWKWDKDELPGRSENIKIFKWFPQANLLRHPNIKLFITQGGLQSTQESINAGVPLIGFPMIIDQWYNVEMYVHYKIGMKLDIETFTEEQLKSAIVTVIENKSYRENVLKLRTLMRDQPQRPLDRAVWWTEYVLRHRGARHLRSPAANISWTKYLEIELVAVLIAIALLSIILTGMFFSYSIKMAMKYRTFCKL